MEPMAARIAALEWTVLVLRESQRRVERQLGRWRILTAGLAVVVLWAPLTQAGTRLGRDPLIKPASASPLSPYTYSRAPRVRRPTAGTSSTVARVGLLERAVSYEEQQIETLGAALNQEIAARQAGDVRVAPMPEAVRPAPVVSPGADGLFTEAQSVTLRKLAGLLVVSGGAIRCNGDLALTAGHALLANRLGPVDADARLDERGTIEWRGTTRCNGDVVITMAHRLLTNQIAPIDAQGRPDEHGTTAFSGNVEITRRLTSLAPAKAPPSLQ
jgi:hypothetical protein